MEIAVEHARIKKRAVALRPDRECEKPLKLPLLGRLKISPVDRPTVSHPGRMTQCRPSPAGRRFHWSSALCPETVVSCSRSSSPALVPAAPSPTARRRSCWIVSRQGAFPCRTPGLRGSPRGESFRRARRPLALKEEEARHVALTPLKVALDPGSRRLRLPDADGADPKRCWEGSRGSGLDHG